ncbi:MAG: hypothetical protein RI953_1239 [Pseudomonadota bacterium]
MRRFLLPTEIIDGYNQLKEGMTGWPSRISGSAFFPTSPSDKKAIPCLRNIEKTNPQEQPNREDYTMKNQILALGLFAALTACGSPEQHDTSSKIAADTSGCSQIFSSHHSATTAHNFSLIVRSESPNSPRCWNADSAWASVDYRWTQTTEESAYKDVGFWVRADGREEFVRAKIDCRPVNTGGAICTASAYFKKFVREIEIAPVRDGSWDTAGIGQNYKFKL